MDSSTWNQKYNFPFKLLFIPVDSFGVILSFLPIFGDIKGDISGSAL